MAHQNNEQHDQYVIPPNFIETGTLFGGSIKIRNAIEAGVLAFAIGVPVFHIPATVTTRIIVACLTVLPVAIFAVVGIAGESLTSFAIHFVQYLLNRRVLRRSDIPEPEDAKKKRRRKEPKPKAEKKPKAKKERLRRRPKKPEADEAVPPLPDVQNTLEAAPAPPSRPAEDVVEEFDPEDQVQPIKRLALHLPKLPAARGRLEDGDSDDDLEEFEQDDLPSVQRKRRRQRREWQFELEEAPPPDRKGWREAQPAAPRSRGESPFAVKEAKPSKPAKIKREKPQKSPKPAKAPKAPKAPKVPKEKKPRKELNIPFLPKRPERPAETASAATKVKKVKKKDMKLEDYPPILKIENGIVFTKDKRYLRIVELEPINFLLRSAREQRSIIYSFVAYLKISPVKMQFKVLTRKADIGKHLDKVYEDMAVETDEHCRILQQDYANLIRQIGSRDAITRRFFLIFEYEPYVTNQRESEAEIISTLETAAHNAKQYLLQCGNDVISHDNEDEFASEVFYSLLCRKSSLEVPFKQRVQDVVNRYVEEGDPVALSNIPIGEFIMPESIDFRSGRYMVIDGVHTAYMYIPSDGYKAQVAAGWTSLMVNAGEGIDLDMFLFRQPKERIQQRLGQQLRINRSKIKDASDTNTDFDDLEGAIYSGYFLKDGLANNQDFYYMSLFLTVTAESEDALEWRLAELKKLLASQDITVKQLTFRHEQAFLSTLPLCHVEKSLFEKSKRNVLTVGAASCYPLCSFEMSDENGILLGVNKHNNSLVIVDIFNSRIYKNANMAILGTSGGATGSGMKSAG